MTTDKLAAIKSLLGKRREPSKAWAERILADPHATDLQRRLATEALAPRYGRREREPGED